MVSLRAALQRMRIMTRPPRVAVHSYTSQLPEELQIEVVRLLCPAALFAVLRLDKTFSTLARERLRNADASLQEAILRLYLRVRLSDKRCSSQDITSMIHLRLPRIRATTVARVTMHTLLESGARLPSSKANEFSRWWKACLDRRSHLLRHSMSADAPQAAHLQAAGLYGVQAFCAQHEWPTGLCKTIFYALYDDDFVLDTGFQMWRSDPGLLDQIPRAAGAKERALEEVGEFLGWLDQAANDDEVHEVWEAADQAAMAVDSDSD